MRILNIKKTILLSRWICYLSLSVLVAVWLSCKQPAPGNNANSLFTLLLQDKTGITFSNNLSYTEEFNPYTYRNFFNGGGVAIGDINNDGLPDIFFCSNQHSNKLYLNKGNFQFEDITEKAGVESAGCLVNRCNNG